MKKRDYIVLGAGVLCIAITLIVGITYAYWRLSQVQTDTNVINSSCFEISFEEKDAITLNNAFPMTDEMGLQQVPFIFTIENKCETWTEYQINLETLKQEESAKVLPDGYVHANLQDEAVKFDATLTEAINPTISEAKNAYKLYAGTLKPSQVKTYSLRLWMDKDVGMNTDSMNASFKAKVTIDFSAITEPKQTTTLNYVVDGAPATQAPAKGNYIVTVDCGSTATASWDEENWTINFSDKKEKDVVCTISFFTDHTGEEVTVGTEHFFIIGENANNYVLLSKYNLDVTNNKQYDASATYSDYKTAFSTSAYWTSTQCPSYPCNLNGIDNSAATAVNAAKDYGTKLGGTGRLLTYEEVQELAPGASKDVGSIKGYYEDILTGRSYTDQGFLRYWLGSASDSRNVWTADGFNSILASYSFSTSGTRGVRPVIEISKDKITGLVEN